LLVTTRSPRPRSFAATAFAEEVLVAIRAL
jgi:hypothetical protein